MDTTSIRAPSRERLYYRLHSATQTNEAADKIAASGELWGTTPRYGSVPAVQAYRGSLPEDRPGVEFTTPVPPDAGSDPRARGMVEWSAGRPGVVTFTHDDVDYVKIPVRVTRIVYGQGRT